MSNSEQPTNAASTTTNPVDQVAGVTLSFALANAVVRQQQDGIRAAAANMMTIASMLSIDIASVANQLEGHREALAAATPPSSAAKAASPAGAAAAPAVAAEADSALLQEVSGKGMQVVAQSLALAIQDATSHLRNLGVIASTATGIALARMLASQSDLPYAATVELVQQIVAKANEDYLRMAEAAVGLQERIARIAVPAGAACDVGGGLDAAVIQTLSLMLHNLANAQSQINVTDQAATTMGVSTLYSIDTASVGVSTREILSGAAAK